MDKNKKVTSKDVAALAGVSQSTVSMILNNKENVSFSSETISKVFDAAHQLNYLSETKSLRIFNIKVILIFTPNITNPYYSGLIQAIEQSSYASGFDTIILNTYRDSELEKKHLLSISSNNIAGIIFTFMPQQIDLVEKISLNTPIVITGDKSAAVSVDTVEINSYKSGTIIGDHLFELGHRNIAFISTTLSDNNAPRVNRLNGLKNRLKELCDDCYIAVKSRNIAPEMELGNIFVEYNVGYELTKECLKDKNLTAFVAVNDMVAYGCINALIEQGYRIPEDYSVCGFDNIFPSQLLPISLTSVKHCIQHIGKNAFNILISKITTDNNTPNSITRVEYQPSLINRSSTAPPRKI